MWTRAEPAPALPEAVWQRLQEIARSYPQEMPLAHIPPRWAADGCTGGVDPAWVRRAYTLRARLMPDLFPRGPVPIGQVVVKELWSSYYAGGDEPFSPLNDVDLSMVATGSGLPPPPDPWQRYRRDHRKLTNARGQPYLTMDRTALLIVLKFPAETPGTDDGWVYATAHPYGGPVRAAGTLPGCMRCHQRAPHERLFVPRP
jgi:hypothetical protein